MKRSDLLLTPGRRILLLLCFFIVGYAVTAALTLPLAKILADRMPAFLRIATVLQDLLLFIAPAIATACIICRRPAELLRVDSAPTARAVLAVALIVALSMPAMEAIIYANSHLHLPECMASFESAAREMEATASAVTETLLRSNTSVAALVLNVLIIGVLAGFSEELLFRGCFQRLLSTGGMNPHAAIWLVAAIFSAFHFQLFGFLPRMLLGAYFGYLLLWTRSLWAPILAHTFNNTVYVVAAWVALRRDPSAPLESESAGELYPTVLIALSAVATVAALAWLYFGERKKRFAKLQEKN